MVVIGRSVLVVLYTDPLILCSRKEPFISQSQTGSRLYTQQCVCFLLISGSEVLLEKRLDTDRLGSAKLNIPGGHMETGETQTDTLIREVQEELGVTPTVFTYLTSAPFAADPKQRLYFYRVDHWTGEISAQESADVGWYSVTERLDISELDAEIIAGVVRSKSI